MLSTADPIAFGQVKQLAGIVAGLAAGLGAVVGIGLLAAG